MRTLLRDGDRLPTPRPGPAPRRRTRVSLLALVVFVVALGVAVGPASGKCIERGDVELCADTDGLYVDVQRASAVLDFGDVPLGQRRSFELTVTNHGNATVAVRDISIYNDTAGEFSVGTTGFSVSPGQSRTVGVTYAPAERGGSAATLGFELGQRAGRVELLGNATAPPPELSVSPRTVRFTDAPVGQTTTRTVTLSNVGESELVVSGAELTEPGPFSIRGDAQVRLAPGERHELQVAYARQRPDPESTTLHVRSNDPAAPTRSVFVTSAPVRATVETRDGRTERTVEMTEMSAGESVAVEMPDDDADRAFELETMTVRPATGGSLSMSMTTSETSLGTSPDFALGDGTTPVGWLSIDHSVPNDQIAEVTYTYRVATDRLAEMGSSPEDVTFYRFESGSWVPKETTVVREGEGYAVLRSTAEGMSEWTAAARRPRLNVTDSSVDLRTATTGEVVTIQVSVTNTGGTDGVYEARLLLNGETVDRRERTVPDGGRVVVNFERTFDSPGEYGVRVNDHFVGEVAVSATNGSAEVRTGGTPADPQRSDGSPDRGGSIPVLPVGVGLVLLASVGIWYYLAD